MCRYIIISVPIKCHIVRPPKDRQDGLILGKKWYNGKIDILPTEPVRTSKGNL